MIPQLVSFLIPDFFSFSRKVKLRKFHLNKNLSPEKLRMTGQTILKATIIY
jgi:hypothetical protein